MKQKLLLLSTLVATCIICMQWLEINGLKSTRGSLYYVRRSITHSSLDNTELARAYYEFNTKGLSFNESPVFIAPYLSGHIIITDARSLNKKNLNEGIEVYDESLLIDFVDKNLHGKD